MDWPNFVTLAENVGTFIEEVAVPLIAVIVPALAGLYIRTYKSVKKLKHIFGKDYEGKLKDWELNFSRQVIQGIGFFIDGIDSSPYCRADQILYIGIVNGIVGQGRLHSMFLSVQAESTSISRCTKKAESMQRIPYTSMSKWCSDLEQEGILKIPYIENSPYTGLIVHETAKSALAVPIYTREKWLLGAVVFNFFDENFNFTEDSSKNEELITSIKTYIEGQFIQMDVARQNFIKSQQQE